MLGQIKGNQFPACQHLTQLVSILGHTVYELMNKLSEPIRKLQNAISEAGNLINFYTPTLTLLLSKSNKSISSSL